MFVNTKKFAICANRLSSRADVASCIQKVHTTILRPNYVAAAQLPLPNNIDPSETTRFSPNRSRDISGTVILSQHSRTVEMPRIDITTDNSSSNMASDGAGNPGNFNHQDPHVQSYDCFGAVSLNSAMQSNVPTPFGGMHKFSHLNMPGGQWSQEGKFMSHNLHSSHYITLRKEARSNWVAYDQDATVDNKERGTRMTVGFATNNGTASGPYSQQPTTRHYCSKADTDKEQSVQSVVALSKKEQLKQAFKNYGATIVVFHVGISLLSLGGCYALVSGGVDLMPILERLGLQSPSTIAANASTFVVAYAIHKIWAPVRISITLGATPFIVRYLRSKGYMKAASKAKE